MPSSNSKTNALVPYKGKVGTDLVNEKIDERILRLLNLEDIFDIDYDTYASLLRERAAAARMSKSKIPTEEAELITDEWKRVKGKKGRFKVTKKKITSQSFKKGSATGVNLKNKGLLPGTSLLALPPADDSKPGKGILSEITEVLDDILKILTDQNNLAKKLAERNRRSGEEDESKDREGKLEKGLGLIGKAAKKIAAPVLGLLERLLSFFVKLFLGRMLYKIVEWFGDKNNREKVGSILKFFKDYWPAILGGFLIFGTGLGGFIANISGVLIRGIAALASRNPVVLGTVIGGGLLAGVTKLSGQKPDNASAVTPGQNQKPEEQKANPQQQQPVQQFKGGGLAQVLGGIKDGLKNNPALGSAIGAVAGSAFGPLGTLLGGVLGGKSGDVGEAIQGLVSGPKGIDKVPAMLTDGEFVMSRGAVAKYGVDTLESMNAAGGGTNKPKVIGGKTYASGGGLVGDSDARGYKKQPDGIYSGGLIADRKKQLSQEAISARLKRIEAQMQVQQALASGRGLNIKGASYGANLGKGFATKYQGRDAIVIKNGVDFDTYSTGIADNEITLGGRVYYAVKRGNDLIYVSNFKKGLAGQTDKYGARNKSYKGKGGGLMSGLSSIDKKNLPKTKIMMGPDGPFVGYLVYKNGEPSYQRATQRNKGMLESLADFFDPKGAKGRQETLNARTMRLTAISDLEDMRRRGMTEENIKKMLNERLGPNGYTRANNDLKAKKNRAGILNQQTTRSKPGESITAAKYAAEQKEGSRRGGAFGQLWRTGAKLFGSDADRKRIGEADKASQARINQRVASSQGKYYSSSDGKTYANYAAADKARKDRLAKLAAAQKKKSAPGQPNKPAVAVRKYNTRGGGTTTKPPGKNAGTSTPKFGATCPNPSRNRKAQQLGLHRH